MMPDKVKCPGCGKPQAADPNPDKIYYCPKCGAQFDSTPDEGGSYSDRNPAARLEREERERERKLQRRR